MLTDGGKVLGTRFGGARGVYARLSTTNCPVLTLIYELKGDIGKMAMLRVFNPRLRVNARDAKQDKVILRYTNWQVYTEGQNLNLLFEALGRSPASQRLHEVDGDERLGERHDVRVFRSIDPRLPRVRYAFVRGVYAPTTQSEREEEEGLFPISAGDRGRVPLFRGRLNQHDYGNSARLVFDELQLNVTRFVAYQPVSTGPIGAWPEPVLYADRRSPNSSTEFVLGRGDDNRFPDNIIMSDEQLLACRPRNWQFHLARYWASVRECLDYRIAIASRIANVGLRNSCECGLRTVETYWEFLADNPISLVHDLAPYLQLLGADYSDRRYPAGYRELRRDRNSPAVRVLLRPGVFLRLYAKTNRRVRFEISHDFRKERVRLSGEAQVERQSSDPSRLRYWINACAEDAAERLNEALAFIQRYRSAEQNAPNLGERPYSLLRLIGQAASNEGIAKALLEFMCEHGVIEVQDGSPLRRAVQALQSRGVLERTRRGASSVRIAAEYRHAIEMIRHGRFR